MNHFIYAMNSTDPAPATGGDTKSWFEYYKWDVDGCAYVPVSESLIVDMDWNVLSTLWFVMDDVILGCVRIDSFMPCLQGDTVELHYNTKFMQVAPTGALAYTFGGNATTGKADDPSLFDALKRTFDAQYPPRNQAAAEGLPTAAT